MKVVINHDSCQHANAFADRCLAATIRNPLGHERYCAAELLDDEQAALTIALIFEGQEYTLTLRSEAEREAVASEGWPAFLRGGLAAAPASIA